jgi:hypothetical protein
MDRSFTARVSGPLTLELHVPHGSVTVRVGGTDRGRLDLHADEQSAPMLREASEQHSSDTWTIRLPDSPTVAASRGGVVQTAIAHGGATIIQTAGGTFVGDVLGAIHTGSGAMYVNGRRVAGVGAVLAEDLRVEVALPEGCSLRLRGDAVGLSVAGTLRLLDVETGAGGVRADRVDTARIHTSAGGVRLGRTDLATVTTAAGSIRVDDFGGTAQLTTSAGAIRVHATAGGDLYARTAAGSITITADPHVLASVEDPLDIDAQSAAGRVQLPRRPGSHTGARRRRQADAW